MFQYISDIHLEYITSIPYIKKTADNLFLVGDIGHPGTFLFNKFLKKCSELYKNVFLVYGNHEYYSILRGRNKKIETMKQKLEYARDFPPNVYFLNNSCVYFNKYTQEVKYTLDDCDKSNDYVKIIGSTLWSDKGPKANNFKNIFIEEDQFLTFEYQSNLYHQSKNYILKEVSSDKEIQCILLTHYTTHKLCNGVYLDNKDTNHIQELFKYHNLIAAINGHTHSSINLIVPGTKIRLLANCYGYKNESQLILRYNENSILRLDDTSPVSFYGIYSTYGVNPIEIINQVTQRSLQKYNIGPIDDRTSFLITNGIKDQNIIYASKGFEELTGYTLKEIKGQNCRFLQAPNGTIERGVPRIHCDNHLIFNVKQKVRKNEECQFITFNFKKNSQCFINLITIIPIVVNDMPYMVGFQKDISKEIYDYDMENMDTSIIDTKIVFAQSQPELNNLNIDSVVTVIDYKYLFNCLNLIVFVLDKNGLIRDCNEKFLSFINFRYSDIIQTNITNYGKLYPINRVDCVDNTFDIRNIKYNCTLYLDNRMKMPFNVIYQNELIYFISQPTVLARSSELIQS